MERYDSYKDSGVKWLGEIPSHWDVLALKHILKLKKDIVGKRSSQYDLLSLTLKGVIKRDLDNPEGKFPASFDTYQVVEPNDFIFCNFDNEETPRAVGLSSYKGMITGAYDVLYRNNPKLSDKFLIYYFLYIDDAKRFKPLYKGLRKTVPFDSFMSYKIPVPSLKEQNAMVNYLDSATSKIDATIAQQQKMIDLLNERKQIIINNAVTKGLDPNVPMKDSGVDWIGQIPEHWEVKKARLCININNGSDPKLKGDIPVYGSGADSFRTCGEYKEGPCVLLGRKGATLHIPHYIEGRYWNVDTAFDVKTKNGMSLRYYYYLATCFDYPYYMSQTTLPSMTSFDYNRMKLPIPPENEQVVIAKFLEKENQKIDELIECHKRQISLLQERKQIIINDVVTGKVKVI